MSQNEKGGAPCGVLILDKPAGMTSHDAVDRVRRLYGTRAVGHTGTLDPMATGVLVMMIGRATKAAELIAADEKEYVAELTLGVTTDTLDTTGAELTRSGEIPDEAEVRAVCASLVGRYGQIPPMYSAIKRGGVKMVDLARKGVKVDLPPREIEIAEIGVERIGEREYRLSVRCSAGTYIRSLCRDVGEKLGCGGAMSALRRVRSGPFEVGAAHTLDEIADADETARRGLLLPVDELFPEAELVPLPPFFAGLAHSGQPIYLKKIGMTADEGALLRLCDGEGFFALAQVIASEDGPAAKPIKQFRL